MTTVDAHYRELLAPVYIWMAGGVEAATAAGAADLGDCLNSPGLAVDLGAGFGMHALPLAKAGHEVVAIDTSNLLLDELSARARDLRVRAVVADLLSFPQHLPAGRRADLIVCMGDTLTHVAEERLVDDLATLVAQRLAPGGQFIATFRDFTRLPSGPARFIPVRSDDERILTCFLEDAGDTVTVHDILHQRGASGWTMKVSTYSKLKLSGERVGRAFERAGLCATVGSGPRGMIKVTAQAE